MSTWSPQTLKTVASADDVRVGPYFSADILKKSRQQIARISPT
jgi:hypothetical protein